MVLGAGLLYIAACAIAQHFSHGIGMIRFLDNLRWTTEDVLASLIMYLGYREAGGEDRITRHWFLLGWIAFTIGQFLWDIQVAIGHNPFPAPSDLFYLCLAPFLMTGFLSVLLKGLSKWERRTAYLDVASLAVMSLTLILALYLPEWEHASVLENIVAMLYPVLYLTALGIGLLAVVTRRIRLGFGTVGTLLSMGGFAYCWVEWNLRTLRGEALDGTLLGYWFSFATLFCGTGSGKWSNASSCSPVYKRWAFRLERLYPLILVVAACVAVVVGNYHFKNSIDKVVDLGAAIMIVLAAARQSLVVHEQDQLLEAEQKLLRVEEERNRALSQLQSFLDYAPILIGLCDIQGRPLLLSSSFEKIIGGSREELLGKTPREWGSQIGYPAGWVDIIEKCNRKVVGERLPVIEELEGKLNGRDICLSITKFPILDPNGEVKVIGLVGIDITEQRRLEGRLRESQKMEAVGQLAGGVAHDFNNILGAMMIGLSMLEDHPSLDEAVRADLREISTNAERAAALTKQLLMFGRRSVLDIRPIELNGVIENLLKMLHRLIGEQIATEFLAGKDLPPIRADRGMMEQVVMNLAVNARDAMPQGGRLTIVTDRIEFHPPDLAQNSERRPGRFVRLSVADTGCGMDEHTVERIFEPFFSTKEIGKGTGLGLATVYGILKQHQGWIEVDTRLGEGSVFSVFLPVPTDIEVALAAIPTGSMRRGSETILLVEDEVSTLQALTRYFKNSGYRILEAQTGREALIRWAEHGDAIDLVFTDMIMPEGMNGLELARRLRRERPGLKVIISSGYSMEMSTDGVPNDEGIIYLSKPFEAKTLGTVLRECLDAKTAG